MLPKFKYIFCLILILTATFLHHPSLYSNKILQDVVERSKNESFALLNTRIGGFANAGNREGLLKIADSLVKNIERSSADSVSLAEACYSTGVSFLLADRYNEALVWLYRCIQIKKSIGLLDTHYANSIYNAGVAYNYLGDIPRVVDHMLEYISVGKEMFGEYSADVAGAYSTLVGASLEQNDYAGFREYTSKTLELLNNNRDALTGSELGRFYINIGTGYARLADYAKARIYFEEAENIYNKYNLDRDHNYVNLINSLAIVYGNLNMKQNQREYYERGMELAVTGNSFLTFNLISNFAYELGRTGQLDKGEQMMADLVARTREVYGSDSRFYFDALRSQADFMSALSHDYRNALPLYRECMEYINRHPEEIVFKEHLLTGYARCLLNDDQASLALDLVQELLFPASGEKKPEKYSNPGTAELRSDRRMLGILRLKYDILKKLYSEIGSREILENKALTSELIISLVDMIRINISAEESRIILGDNFRDSYLNAIYDCDLCYRTTGEKRYINKAFEFAEKSKAASLLAATKEMNAVNFHIPTGVADMERSLQRQIAFYNNRITTENQKDDPDRQLLSEWNNSLLTSVKVRDSLVATFEKSYPEYYALKYATGVLTPDEVPDVAGRKINYLNYIVSDSLVYIFLVNRKHKKMHSVKADSAFFASLNEFRSLLSGNGISVDSRNKFTRFCRTGNDLYSFLIQPVRKYFISGDLLISPDNILSYLPFETFLSESYTGNDLLYRRLPYLMNDFSISYAYSASLIRESPGTRFSGSNEVIAFAPLYTDAVYVDSLLVNRDVDQKILYDLPFARIEAGYIADLTKGTLYLNEQATESVFKAEAGKYDIIHLAMHTWLNDRNPMASAMIFSKENDSQEDGLLNTYEVYGIPLKARMVVLSSCNTGTGYLSTGEGILSLARGFIYSGCRSVVMSMWEIEDRSGTEIVKMFYDNLMLGRSKSQALKLARRDYLKNASQLKSHPYFWSSLVIYGDDSPVSRHKGAVIIILCAISLFLAGVYLLYRRYS